MLVIAVALAGALQPLDTQLHLLRAAYGSPGLVVAIVRPGVEPRFICSGVTNLTDLTRVTPDTLFPIGSCTKSFTSALAAKLSDEGAFCLDVNVRTHLPEFHLADPTADAAVTPRDLLSHRTGVEGHDLLWYRVPWTQAESVARLKLLQPVGDFRTSYHYSSLQYLAAGQALSAAAKRPWADLVRDKLTTPLGMVATTFVTPTPAANQASGHRRSSGEIVPMPQYRLTEPNAAGSIVSSARDLARWAEFQLGCGSFRGRQVVSSKALAQTHTPHVAMPLADKGIGSAYPATTRADYCQGWVRFDHRGLNLLAHGGVSDGFRAQITLCPDRGFAVVVLSNLHKTWLNVTVTDVVLESLAGLPPRDWGSHFLAVERAEQQARVAALAERDTRRGVVNPPGPLADYCGTYAEPAYGTIDVSERGGGLRFRWAGLDADLTPYSGDYFRFTDGPTADELVEFAPHAHPKALRVLGRVFLAK